MRVRPLRNFDPPPSIESVMRRSTRAASFHLCTASIACTASNAWRRDQLIFRELCYRALIMHRHPLMSDLPSKQQATAAAVSKQSTADVTAGLAWLHGSSLCTGVFITPNRMLCPRCVCASWQAASSLVVKRRHATDSTVLSVTCDPSDCFLANSILDIVIIGVSPKFAQAAHIRPVPISWPPSSSSKTSHRSVSGPAPAVGAGYRLYRRGALHASPSSAAIARLLVALTFVLQLHRKRRFREFCCG